MYVHVPFCRSRCDYCAFATWTDRHHLTDDYLAAVRLDIERAFAAEARRRRVGVRRRRNTVARPSRPLVASLQTIPLAAGAEVTVECNPDDVDVELLAV